MSNLTSAKIYEETSTHEKILIQTIATIGSIQCGMLLVTILTCPALRKKITYVYVINLLLAQLLLSTITVPMYCFAPHHILYPYITALTIIAYILNLCTVSYERYLAICQPYFYTERISYSRALKTSIGCWIIATIMQILPIFWDDHQSAILIHRIYLGITLILFFIVPLLMIWIVYGYISYEIYHLSKKSKLLTQFSIELVPTAETPLNGHHKDTEDGKGQRKKSYLSTISTRFRRKSITKPRQEISLAMVFITAAIASNIAWVPVILMVFLQVIDRTDLEPRNISKIHIYLLAINANIDPLIYGLFLKPLRKRLINFIIIPTFKIIRKGLARRKQEKPKTNQKLSHPPAVDV